MRNIVLGAVAVLGVVGGGVLLVAGGLGGIVIGAGMGIAGAGILVASGMYDRHIQRRPTAY